MLLDVNLQFSNAQAITITAPSSGVYDEALGTMSTGLTYTNPVGVIFGNGSAFDNDLGIGAGPGTPRVVVSSGPNAFLSGVSMRIQFQGAPDNLGGTFAGLTWTTYIQTDDILLAALIANTRLASFDWPIRKVGVPAPRFIRLNYVTSGTFTAGVVNADLTLGGDDAQAGIPIAAANYTVAA